VGIETGAEPLVHGLRDRAQDGGEPRLINSRGADIIGANAGCPVAHAKLATESPLQVYAEAYSGNSETDWGRFARAYKAASQHWCRHWTR